nr:cuticle collagen 1-like [Aotus nancymaae]
MPWQPVGARLRPGRPLELHTPSLRLPGCGNARGRLGVRVPFAPQTQASDTLLPPAFPGSGGRPLGRAHTLGRAGGTPQGPPKAPAGPGEVTPGTAGGRVRAKGYGRHQPKAPGGLQASPPMPPGPTPEADRLRPRAGKHPGGPNLAREGLSSSVWLVSSPLPSLPPDK